MPTPAERQALVFFAAVAALGIGVNAWRAARGGDAVIAGSPGELAAQIARVDSAVASSPSRELRRKKKGESASARVRERPAASSSNHQPPTTSHQPPAASHQPPTATGPLDLDLATVAAIESLPRIGPALAHRIVANRDSFGAFGSIEGLQRVRGIGPAIAKSLRDVVTFSGVPRPGAPPGVVKDRRRRSVP
ncbi:MAG: helix-hairpin-helix domain-containing protein [Gemmatimonadota bacterium]